MDPNGVIALNVNSIRSFNRTIQLELFIKDNKANIVFLSETHFKKQNIFKINNFNVFKQCRHHKNGGGTAILLNNKIKYKNLKTFNNTFEAISIDVFLNGNGIRLISMYIPPHSNITANDLITLFNVEIPIILGGDLNARHTNFGDISNNRIGTITYNFLQESGNIRIDTNIPTYNNTSFLFLRILH